MWTVPGGDGFPGENVCMTESIFLPGGVPNSQKVRNTKCHAQVIGKQMWSIQTMECDSTLKSEIPTPVTACVGAPGTQDM